MATIDDLLHLLENGWSPHQARQSLKVTPSRIRQMMASRRFKELVDLHQQMALVMSQYRACCSMVQAVRILEHIVCAQKEPGEVSRRAAGQLLRMLGLMAGHDRDLLKAQKYDAKLSAILHGFSSLVAQAQGQNLPKAIHTKDLQENTQPPQAGETNTNHLTRRKDRDKGLGQHPESEEDVRTGNPAWPPEKDAAAVAPHDAGDTPTAHEVQVAGLLETAQPPVCAPAVPAVSPVFAGPRRPRDAWAGRPCHFFRGHDSNSANLPLKQACGPTPAVSGRIGQGDLLSEFP